MFGLSGHHGSGAVVACSVALWIGSLRHKLTKWTKLRITVPPVTQRVKPPRIAFNRSVAVQTPKFDVLRSIHRTASRQCSLTLALIRCHRAL